MNQTIRYALWITFGLLATVLVVGFLLYTSKSNQSTVPDQEQVVALEVAAEEPEETPAPEPEAEPRDEAVSPAPLADTASTPAPLPEPAPIAAEAPASEGNIPNVGPFADSSVKVQETIKIDPPITEIGQAWLSGESQNNFSMPVTGGRNLDIDVERFEAIEEEGGVFIGRVKDRPDSSVRLSYRGRAEAGSIRLPSENLTYRIFPGQSGSVVVQERDMAIDESNAAQPPANFKIPPVPDFTPPPPPTEVWDNPPE